MPRKARIILASKSAARRSMLENVGISFEIMPSQINEAAIQDEMDKDGYAGPGMALELAKQKARVISEQHPEALVIGSDQTLEFKDKIINKARTEAEAKDKLRTLRGEEHKLVSAVSVAQNGNSMWQHIDDAHLTMHNFSDDFLERYCTQAREALTNCVGAYELEKHGSWLFSSVKGDFFTILGMPLLPLLDYLSTTHGVRL